MVEEGVLGGRHIAAELAAALPRFDPLAHSSRSATGRRLLAVSLTLHLLLLFAFWDALLGAIEEVEETVTVRMIDEPEPEPPKLKRKVIAQRRIDTSVRRFKEIVQREVRVVKPVPVLDQTQRVEVDAVQLAEAPKLVERRDVVAKKISAFADLPTKVQPIRVDRVAPTVRSVQSARLSAGPRRLDAAAPVTDAQPVDLETPAVARGALSRAAIDGDVTGAKVAALESGTSERMLRGDGQHGLIGGASKNCNEDPVCLAYLEMIEERVYRRWQPGSTDRGTVRLRFRIDRGGTAHGIKLVNADHKLLGDSCVVAFQHASPFPPPPKEIHYLVTKGILATFSYGD